MHLARPMNNATVATGTDSGDVEGFKLALIILSIAVLTFLSQTFTGARSFGESTMLRGLNIGLMSLDTAQLQVMIDVPNKDWGRKGVKATCQDEAAMDAARYARSLAASCCDPPASCCQGVSVCESEEGSCP